MGYMEAKEQARAAVEQISEELVGLSHRIHGKPELAFEEESSSAWCAEMLTGAGFDVEDGVCGLPTAFVATAGSGPLTIAVCAEYDALPGIGHACGHNVIAAAGVGAGLALAQVADDIGITVKVMGTPAEEGGGGKIIMLDGGAFEGVNAAMMVHPSPHELARQEFIASQAMDISYKGKSAHASAYPHEGINAADAVTVAQVAIGLLRQQITAKDRIHGIVTKGGDASNIIPESAGGRWQVRSRTLEDLAVLEPRVKRCFEAGALATGCELSYEPREKPYSEFVFDDDMVELYRRNAEALGRTFSDLSREDRERASGSTDMANVSLALPAIHPMLGLDSLPAVNHQPEFAAHCATDIADKAALEGAIAMAWTTIDIAADEAMVERLVAHSA